MTFLKTGMKSLRFHKKTERDITSIDIFTRSKIAETLTLLAKGESLGMPLSRPMPIVAQGVHELRIKSADGQYRIFYYTKHQDAILVFHCFKKKTQKTPDREIRTAQKRLGEML